VRLRYTDQKGIVKPLERNKITVKVEGGELVGLGNGCPYNETGYLCDTTDTYYGQALAAIRVGNVDELIVIANDGNEMTTTSITVI